jgi:hypothetical protein
MSGFFDDVARTLATPMPRRRALRTIGSGLAVAAVGALRPGAAAGRPARAVACPQTCSSSTVACCVAIKYGFHIGGCCRQPGEDCCVGPNLDQEHPNQMSWCCPTGTCEAAGGRCKPGCPPNTFKCGTECCRRARPTLPQEVCYHGHCRPACPDKTKKCGDTCCTSKQKCRNGKCCEKCGGNGTCCDPATTFCCREPGKPKSPGRCCKKGKETCCGVGPDGAQKRMCCPKPNKCTKQLPRTVGGLTKTSPWVCCPPARQVPADENHPNDITACCAPGQVSLGGKLVVGQGVQGLCCDEDRICGSGAGLTCCQTGESCIGGTTCA